MGASARSRPCSPRSIAWSASGAPELVLVSGYSGIGKSSVVNELHRALVPPRGLFASGKFDQYKRDIPYATLAQAFQGLVRSLLGKSDAELVPWREALREALGPKRPAHRRSRPRTEAHHRRAAAGSRARTATGAGAVPPGVPPLYRGLCAPEHPLALFLDDLQWLDMATLDLLEDLLIQTDVRHLLLIGAYRDNEVDASHPLIRKLDAIRAAGAKVSEIKLGAA